MGMTVADQVNNDSFDFTLDSAERMIKSGTFEDPERLRLCNHHEWQPDDEGLWVPSVAGVVCSMHLSQFTEAHYRIMAECFPISDVMSILFNAPTALARPDIFLEMWLKRDGSFFEDRLEYDDIFPRREPAQYVWRHFMYEFGEKGFAIDVTQELLDLVIASPKVPRRIRYNLCKYYADSASGGDLTVNLEELGVKALFEQVNAAIRDDKDKRIAEIRESAAAKIAAIEAEQS
jgi:hypothetical protein